MILARAALTYDHTDQDRMRLALERNDKLVRKQGQDVVIAGTERLLLYSPDGSAWQLVVSDAGVLSAVAA